MEQDKFAHYLKTLSKMLNIPIAYCTQGGEVLLYQPFAIITPETDISFISSRLQPAFDKFPTENVMYCITPQLVLLGMVRNLGTGEIIFVGPLASSSTTPDDVERYLETRMLTKDTYDKLANYLNSYKFLSQAAFFELLSNINLVLNNEIRSPYDLVAVYDDATSSRISFAQNEYVFEMSRQDQYDVEETASYNRKLNYCIINGDLDGLADMLDDLGRVQFIENSYTEDISEMKIVAFGSIFAAEANALKSGIPSADIEQTKRFYLHRINSCTDLDTLRQLILNALFEFTKHVKDFLTTKTDNPTINRAIDFIKNNITTKLVAEDIAAALNINEHYLFTKFKKETGRTLTQYINEEKVKKSCYYLQFTDKPLSEIAAFLSFSSQSYFQSVFKKVLGQTPSEWRRAATAVVNKEVI